MSKHEAALPLVLFLIWPERERLQPIFDRLEAKNFQVLLHRLGTGSSGSELAALYDSYDFRLLVYPFNSMSDGALYGITNDSFSYVKAVKARGIPVMSMGMDLGGIFDDELEISGHPDEIVAKMLRAMEARRIG
jgi:hypothetical protein